ncbi:DUF7660 family protein [Nocardia uniformis]|uniref:DUF7660 family protein n=1 Tax=Nocardia uniformis TaxID=53432 RepID=UPI000B0AB28E
MAELGSDGVYDRTSFVRFLNELSSSVDQNPNAYENLNSGRFIEAAAAWIDDMDGYYEKNSEPVPHDINWRFIAQLFCAGLVYE